MMTLAGFREKCVSWSWLTCKSVRQFGLGLADSNSLYANACGKGEEMITTTWYSSLMYDTNDADTVKGYVL